MPASLELMPKGRIPVAIADIKEVELVELLGMGGFGQVWKVKDIATNKLYALKIIQNVEPESSLGDRVKLEAEVSIDSPYVVPAVGLHQWDEATYLILFEYYSGKPLDELLAAGKLDAAQKGHIFRQILLGVRDAHRHNIIHRDLKPGNILVNEDDVVKVIDFGISKFQGVRNTRTGETMGTPNYMPIEAFIEGSFLADARTDIYALGHLLYELEMGQHFWQRNGWKRVEQFLAGYLNRKPEPTIAIDLSDFSGEIYPNSREAIAAMVKTHVEKRIASIDEILELLKITEEIPPTEVSEKAIKTGSLGFPLLWIETGTNRNACLPLSMTDGETRIIGRLDIAGNDGSISRKHLCVARKGETYTAEDNGSKNGTLYQGFALPKGQSVTLNHGDRLKLGDIFLRVEFSEEN